MLTARQWGLAAAGLWALAAVASIPFFGLGGLLNVPQWLLNMMEAVEFFVWTLSGNNPLELLGAVGRTREANEILLGLITLPAWLAGIGATVNLGRDRRWRPALVLGLCLFVVSPVTTGVAAYWSANKEVE